MFKESVKMKGNLNLLLIDQFGNIKLNKNYPNLVVDSGKAYIAQRMTSNSTTVMSSIAVGTDNTSPANTDISLGTEIDRVNFSSATVSSNTITYVASFGVGSAIGALQEAGIFNSSTANSGTMLCRTTFPVVTKETNDTFTITWNVSPN